MCCLRRGRRRTDGNRLLAGFPDECVRIARSVFRACRNIVSLRSSGQNTHTVYRRLVVITLLLVTSIIAPSLDAAVLKNVS